MSPPGHHSEQYAVSITQILPTSPRPRSPPMPRRQWLGKHWHRTLGLGRLGPPAKNTGTVAAAAAAPSPPAKNSGTVAACATTSPRKEHWHHRRLQGTLAPSPPAAPSPAAKNTGTIAGPGLQRTLAPSRTACKEHWHHRRTRACKEHWHHRAPSPDPSRTLRLRLQ
jgi:hypothetical protein